MCGNGFEVLGVGGCALCLLGGMCLFAHLGLLGNPLRPQHGHRLCPCHSICLALCVGSQFLRGNGFEERALAIAARRAARAETSYANRVSDM